MIRQEVERRDIGLNLNSLYCVYVLFKGKFEIENQKEKVRSVNARLLKRKMIVQARIRT